MINTIAAIAAGGAIGALMRHGVNIAAVKIMGHGFPYGTLTVNILGSFLMGAIIIAFAQIFQPTETMRVFIITGLLGAFTTFSTFSLDVATLFERGEYLTTAAYLSASVVLSIAALFAGMAIVKGFIS
ncbi:MAG: fluoride efflux transporter CrcB [Alphaproteobacteria bacterium]|nr:fluoride efflux transporter CrcB [Alphaproteobacteria bacterium]